jgi:hypothetical protein
MTEGLNMQVKQLKYNINSYKAILYFIFDMFYELILQNN